MDRNTPAPPIEPRLGLWDAVSLIIGIVVGTAIFKSPMMVFQNTTGPWQALGAWLLGGVLSLCGAFCYAELATTFPRDGGDYEYLSRAYGRWLGFLFSWCRLTVILSACIGTMAYAFVDYAAAIWPFLANHAASLAAGTVVAISVLNSLGEVIGKTAQNVLSALKVLGLLGLVAAGLWAGSSPPAAGPGAAAGTSSFGLAMVFVLYAYGGWSDAAFVAAEVRDQRRNMPRALLLGTTAVIVLYVAVNASYLAVLGFDAARQSPTPAADVFEHAFGGTGRTSISLLVMLSALGAINGMIFTNARVYATLGEDFERVAWLGVWNRSKGVPFAALALQCVSAVLMILAVGTAGGRSILDSVLTGVGLHALPWDKFASGFDTLLTGSAPVFWLFFVLSGAAVIVFRIREPNIERPFRVPYYPSPPIVFCATSIYMIYSSLDYAGTLALLSLAPVIVGAILLLVVRPRKSTVD